ncbi:MAG: hypothetical protein EPGJADBJ_03812 [Saprospiraceae bacterium]|nr:hypothetical protein [Saprospiraceae bacterium]
MRITFYLFVLPLVFLSCQQDENPPIANAETGEQYAGGPNATTFDFGENAFGVQAKGLTAEEEGFFVTGNSFFRANWVTAPASVLSLDGLGPIFNAISCGSCHFKDGRAMPPGSPDESLNCLLFRLSIPGMGAHGEPLGDPVYGAQLQDKAILNVKNEGRVHVTYQETGGQYADGMSYSLRKPVYEFYDLNYGDFAPGLMFSPRIAPQVPGLGLLEIVPESDILSFADENDADKDGISGRPNYVWDFENQQIALGRFGWKANQPSVTQQTAGAFNGDIGITTNLFPDDHLTPAQQQLYLGIPNGGSPELPDATLRKVVSYMKSLSVPARRNHDDATVLRGKYLFGELNCSGCHRPAMNTGTGGEISALRNQKIWPYTDLLLHDMGTELADNRPDYLASGSQWRTPPLWGIGLIPTVNGHTFLLHDGRARTVEEAILWHGGEAEKAREGFKKLSKEDREAILEFLNSL